ncbi:hypothetical protein RM704_37645 [Streptomyces sp. DSM 3412]|uniref:Uncharacterized protein n=1 Tax=Streptomyces gottesmaniae TaxID=3075518 RepID=A0ABU2Z936_9ACTN|nr:hypothetical protein [Streptomyces sp. DSM 3412]MDT0573115.1 hypothetical protein [Streptomyces sp. DSM 3412]
MPAPTAERDPDQLAGNTERLSGVDRPPVWAGVREGAPHSHGRVTTP